MSQLSNTIRTTALILCASVFMISSAYAQKWVKLAAFPDASEEVYGISSGGKLYVLGGLAPGWTPKGLVYEYDPADDTWTKKKNMPVSAHHVAVAELNGKIYVIGGRLGNAFIGRAANTDVVEGYDPATDQWSPTLTRMPTPRSALTWGTYKGKIYVAGGEMQNAYMAAAFRAVEAFDPATNTWSTLPSLEFPRHGAGGDIVGSRLHVVTGVVQASGSGGHSDVDFHHALELESK